MRAVPLLLLLTGCGLEQTAAAHIPRAFVVPLVHWHFPAGLSTGTPHFFPYDPPDKE